MLFPPDVHSRNMPCRPLRHTGCRGAEGSARDAGRAVVAGFPDVVPGFSLILSAWHQEYLSHKTLYDTVLTGALPYSTYVPTVV